MSAIDQARSLDLLYSKDKTLRDLVVSNFGSKLEDAAIGNLSSNYRWNDQIFIPLHYWHEIFVATLRFNRARKAFINVERVYEAMFMSMVAIFTWRYTHGIYRFDDYTYKALLNDPLGGQLRLDNISKLPEWCLYIETPTLTLNGKIIKGVYVHRNCRSDFLPPATPDLLIINFDIEDVYDVERRRLHPLPYAVFDISKQQTFENALISSFDLFDKNSNNELIGLFKVIFGLINAITDESAECVSELLIKLKPTISNFKTQVIPDETQQNRIRLIAPSNPRIWYVGTEYGCLWRMAQNHERIYPEAKAVNLMWTEIDEKNGEKSLKLKLPHNLNYQLEIDIYKVMEDWQNNPELCENLTIRRPNN